ncbi:MAG: hypothetical protein Q4P78_07530 [Rothia sp. (in: high G+C Gram-positive bacteria)]|uniref:hypothetical protein n=1 Tax=Rothia sp. (in: high G+C Gram-positive bacteria) TaxID=1885016 RepID=UPI0026DEA374|nr:hypothetical protein [Rothia sp. (in: high G+C Gram-positive bacteria)]MDO5751028.1 hypothetical protein [Rothia sp. (in: high G+C Gram-positive bacteria)]
MTQPSAVGNVTENSTDFMLAPGEANVYGDRFLISIIAPYLKGQMMCSTTRFVFKVPNTLLGIIPVGSNENTMPISAIAAVSTSSKLRVGRAILALIFILVGLSSFGGGTGGAIMTGIICTLLGISFAATCMPMVLLVQNHAGGATALEVAIFERAKLERFRQELQNRVFADMSQIRHDQAQQTQNQQLNIQQMQLQQQIPQPTQQQIPQPAPQPQQIPQPTQPLPQPNQQPYGYQQG